MGKDRLRAAAWWINAAGIVVNVLVIVWSIGGVLNWLALGACSALLITESAWYLAEWQYRPRKSE
jgi:hypothetical protein